MSLVYDSWSFLRAFPGVLNFNPIMCEVNCWKVLPDSYRCMLHMSVDKENDEYPITCAWLKKKTNYKTTIKKQHQNNPNSPNLKILFQILLLGIPWSSNFQKNPFEETQVEIIKFHSVLYRNFMFQHIANKFHYSFLGRPANLNGHSDKPPVFWSQRDMRASDLCVCLKYFSLR